jgi:3-oxoacyl-[acyl-carrier protein] reductase
MTRSLTGRRALVTAGSSGIGRAIAARLRACGAAVVITGTGEHTAAVADELGAGWVRADFTDPAAPAAAVTAAAEQLGGIDVLVANTGGPRPAPFAELTAADWRGAYDLILGSAIELVRAALPGMRAAGWGRLVFVTSTAGVVRPLPGLHLSNVMRAGVAALAQSLVGEAGPDGVTANVIAPGPIDTERRRQIMGFGARRAGVEVADFERSERERIPVRSFGRPEQLAALTAFLCSEDGAFTTGGVHVVDGGSSV